MSRHEESTDDNKDTEDLYSIGFQKVASRYGKEFTFALKCKIMGQQSREFSKMIIDELELPLTVDEFIRETREIFDQLFPDCTVMSATSSSVESYELKVQNHLALFELMPYKTWGSSDPAVKRGKPHPDIFIVAANKFPDKPSLDKVDSINGVAAARAAGMQVVMVPDPRLDRALAAAASLVLPSVEHFQPELFGLPPYTD
ncbi:2-deoxyglucose-6-phosphate phosphatase [Operophtera brumata]|uniref:2-deoxyglucose-6-phosphate phosphatase n=1 Tax=Operophtera brumata TaxID=104452 RepID=A0A0L7L3Q9_OPEBR|nr:2-deoxyglucose-6-phosphate phosphatase [Operophtera brumata]